MSPEVRTPSEYRALAAALHADPRVRAATRTTRPDGYSEVLEVVLAPGVERVPPGVLRVVADHDFGIGDVSPQGSPKHLIVEVQ